MPEPLSSESPKPPSWSEWKARNGGKLWCWRAMLAVEWALEWFVYRLRGLALFDLLELAGKLTVVIAVIFWFLEADDRAKQRHYRAWELINAARGSTGDGGRREALQDLNKDGVSLAAAPLHHAFLSGIDLKGADLEGVNLESAILWRANLQDADLRFANLQGATLGNANLRGANLQGANLRSVGLMFSDLQGASLVDVKLQDADLQGAKLQGANLVSAALHGANFFDANIESAYLAHANLQGASLAKATLQGADLWNTNLKDARNLTQQQLEAADGNNATVLPDGLTRPAHWSKAEAPEGPPAAQPDAAGSAPAKGGAPEPGE